MIVLQRTESVLSWASVAVDSAAIPVLANPAAHRQGIQLTNVSGTQIIYLGYDDSVSATKFVKRLAPGEFFEILAGAKVPFYAIASANGAALSVAEVA